MTAQAAWQAAYGWLCHTRRHAPPNADVWHLRFYWATRGDDVLAQVQAGQYRLSPMQGIGQGQGRLAVWCAQDALVLKWVTLQLNQRLPTHVRCAHLKGRGGAPASVGEVGAALRTGRYAFVYRTDIRGYYRHIRKAAVVSLVGRYVDDPVLLDLVHQYVHYSVETGGEFYTPKAGICRGCSLSPLIGAAMLYHVDQYFGAQAGVFYGRYMDDFVVLAPGRWPLRRAVKALHRYFTLDGFEAHPDKTQLGRIADGFEWMGVWFSSAEPSVGLRALNNHRERRVRLYEQARARGQSNEEAGARVRAYEARWQQWAARMLRAAQFN
ncbi:TPA: transposase [Serratia marcescens]|nr:transposase [Serratia marcescens]